MLVTRATTTASADELREACTALALRLGGWIANKYSSI
jgi:hypothetical protein